jgi:hypothetical protein
LAEERDFGEFAASGCKNRNGHFIIRGLVSSANEGTLVLADPTNAQSTTSVSLPGRGGDSREATNQKLAEGTGRLRSDNEKRNPAKAGSLVAAPRVPRASHSSAEPFQLHPADSQKECRMFLASVIQ